MFSLKKWRKKASVDQSISTIVGAVIAIILLIGISALIFSIVGVFTDKPDQGTINNYNKVVEGINTLFAKEYSDKDYMACYIPLGYIKPNWAFVGFPKAPSKTTQGGKRFLGEEFDDCVSSKCEIKEHCGVSESVVKPRKCSYNACLCLCNGGVGDVSGDDCFKDQCIKFTNKIEGMVRLEPQEGGYKRTDFVIYGEECGTGKDRKVLDSYVLVKSSNLLEIIEMKKPIDRKKYEDILIGEIGDYKSFLDEYEKVIPTCQQLKKGLQPKKTTTQKSVTTTSEPDVRTQLDKNKVQRK